MVVGVSRWLLRKAVCRCAFNTPDNDGLYWSVKSGGDQKEVGRVVAREMAGGSEGGGKRGKEVRRVFVSDFTEPKLIDLGVERIHQVNLNPEA